MESKVASLYEESWFGWRQRQVRLSRAEETERRSGMATRDAREGATYLRSDVVSIGPDEQGQSAGLSSGLTEGTGARLWRLASCGCCDPLLHLWLRRLFCRSSSHPHSMNGSSEGGRRRLAHGACEPSKMPRTWSVSCTVLRGCLPPGQRSGVTSTQKIAFAHLRLVGDVRRAGLTRRLPPSSPAIAPILAKAAYSALAQAPRP